MPARTAGSAAAPQAKDWRAKAQATGDKRFTLTKEQKKKQEKLKQHLPRVHKAISKTAAATGYPALAILTDDTPKRPVGKQAKAKSHTATTIHAVASGGDVATGATGAQAKDVLIGQLESFVEKLRKPSTQVKFVKPPPVHASSKQKNAALIEKLAAIVAPSPQSSEE